MITSSERILSKKSSILILSSVLILIIILLAYLYYTISSEDIKHEKQNDLEAISKLKIGQFTQWHFERTGDVKIMSTSPVFVNMVAAWLNNRNDDKSLKNIIEQLEITRKNYEYENIFLASTNAELLCAAIDNLEKLDPITKGKILEAQEKNNLTYSDFYYCPTHNKIHYDILAPIYNKGLIIANLVFRVDPSVYLYPLIKTWPYSSKSAESILIRKDGDSVLFLNELRHQKNTALKFRLPLSRKDLPAVQAASGRIGIFEGVDYRGVEVLAYLNSVPGTNWFMVVKMDRSEIYAELNFRQSIIALIAGLLLILILIGLISIYYQRQNTVFKKLWEEQEKFRTTLYSIGDAVIVTDINSKVKHLNLTAERLTGWKEKDAINKPLEDVFKIINEENRVGIQDPVQRILSHGSDFELADQILLVSKNGTETPISESVATIRNEKNEIDGAVIVFQDQSKIRETQKIIQKNEIIVRSILDNLPVGISVNSTDSTKPFKYMNNNYSKFFDAPAEALRDQSKIWDTVFEDEALRQIMKRKMIADVESGDPNRMHWEDIPITKSGKEIRFVSVKSIPIPENNLILSTVMDVTDRKLAEKEIIKFNRLYALLSQTNQAIVRLKNRDELFKEITKSAREFGEFSIAWIGLIEGIENKIVPHTYSGKSIEFIEKELNPENAEMRNQVPAYKAVVDNKIIIHNDVTKSPEYAHLTKYTSWYDINSVAAIPLALYKKNVGVLVLYSSEKNFFGKKEVKLVEEMAGDINFALETYDKEAKRILIEKKSALLSHTIEQSINEIYIIDAVTFKFKYVNAGGLNNLGYTISELYAMSPIDIAKEMTYEEFLSLLKPLLEKSEELIHFETIHYRKNGSKYPCEIRLQLFTHEDEKVYLAFVVDITERKKAAEKLSESELKFRTVVTNAKPIIFMIDKEGKFLLSEGKMLASLGLKPGQVVGQSAYEIYKDYPKVIEGINSALSGVHYDDTIDINGIILEVFYSPIKNSKGIVSGLIGMAIDITERVKAEDAVRNSEEKYRLIAENVTDVIFVMDLSLNISYTSPSLYKLLGYTPQEAVNMKLSSLMTKESFHLIQQIFQNELMKEEEGGHDPYRTRTIQIQDLKKDGTRIWVEVIASFIRDKNGKPVGVLAVSRDISERKLAEDALRKSEERYRQIFDEDLTGDFISTVEGEILLCNPALVKMLGFDNKDALMKTNISALYPSPQERQEFLKLLKKRKKLELYEHQLKRTDGKIITVVENVVGEFNDAGELIAMKGYLFDITDRKEAEENLRKLSRGIEQSPAVIVITDSSGNIEYVNPKFTEVTGYYFDEVVGKNPRILGSGEKTKEDYRDLWTTISNGGIWRGEFHNKKKNGELYWESASISPIFNEQGRISHFIAVKEDITKQREMVSELIAAKEKAEEMNKVKSYFFANMSHELRTPFVGIQGYAELLAESLTDSESLQMVNSIIESSKRLTDTLDKILSLSKLEFEGIQVQKADVNINDLLRECYSLFISLSNQKGIKFNLKLLDTPISIVTDEKLLRGIICNLVNNAIKFTPKGKVELAASIYSSNDSNYLRILVSDTGIGIPKEKQDQIWMAFRQASEGLSRTFEGTGLGLTITRKYVELLGGNILLESEYGKGSSFIVELEVGKNYDQNLENKQIDFPKSEERLNQDIKDGKILYVEDDEYSRDVVVRTLSKLHFVETAASAEKALEMMEREKYDVILIDINLKHGMDGVQLMEKVKKIPYYRGVPLVAVTAYASETDRDEFLSKGFSNYISKPFVLSKLQKYVKEIYDNSRETD